MKIKTVVIGGLSLFFIFCAALIADAAFHHPQQTQTILNRIVPLAGTIEDEKTLPDAETELPKAAAVITASPVIYPELRAANADEQTVTLGQPTTEIERTTDPDKYKFFVILTNKGAAIRNLVSNEFKARSDEQVQTEVLSGDSTGSTKVNLPLSLLCPIDSHGKQVYSLANTLLKVAPADAEQFGTKAFPLDQLNWTLVETDAKDQVRFEATLTNAADAAPMLKILKTYRVQLGSYDLECDIVVENLSEKPIKVLMQMQGPGGMSREGVRQDGRKIKAAYKSSESGIAVEKVDVTVMQKKIEKNDTEAFLLKHKNTAAPAVWSALTNKYFTAIIYPAALDAEDQPRMNFTKALYYPAPTQQRQDKDLQNCSYNLTSDVIELDAAGQGTAAKTLSFKMYAGPKDKNIFEENDTYKSLQFFQTIDFRACCCPQSVIAPLAFGIMWLMNTLYGLMGPLGNYGVVIMILVFLVRLLLHPITKKSQVSMMKMQKLGPKMQEIQKKYANNKAEMNKQVMAMYRDSGVSPVSGMLPMFLQMPIWIALWTAVYTSVDLRGAGFLPFWITDLSMPDQLFAIPYAAKLQSLDIIGKFIPSYFNLLPILMGVVMYLQQKMMPSSQASAQTNPQVAQQQKMMMIMMPLMFPIMLYSGPSGVNLYIMSSITAGVIEQKVIRKHLKEKEEAEAVGKVPVTAKTGGKVKKKKPKPMFKDK